MASDASEPHDPTDGPVRTRPETRARRNFRGRIGHVMAASDPAWPERPVAPEDAPNVVFVLVDDVGFADFGCYGGEIRTPNIDRLAAEGVRFTNFHVNPMCSPTRASLLTGTNCHAAGIGHVAQDDAGFPGYAAELADDVATAAEVFRANGYATLMVGKWHLCRDGDVSAAGPNHSWPLQRGFDRFYGILDAFTNAHHPAMLTEDNHQVEVDRYPDGYYLTDDLVTKAVTMVKERKASNPRQPFFLYVAHPAAHAPLLAMADDMARYRGAYDAGWDEIRAQRHQRQLELGVLPPGTPLPPRNHEPGDDVTAWDDLSNDERTLYPRYMEVYAAMVDRIDQSVGTLRAELEAMGEWDNTIVVFLSDNGASREGEATGTSSYYRHLAPIVGGETGVVEVDLARIDDLGTPRAMAHYPRGWAMASNTPFRLYKRNTHAGGHQVACVWSGGALDGARLGGSAGSVRRQYSHVVDVLPTVIELTGVTPLSDRAGIELQPMDGASLVDVLGAGDAPAARVEQYYELAGNRALYRDGYEVVTNHRARTPFSDEEWELYDLRNDPVELDDLSADKPELVAELSQRFDQVAIENDVYPLDEGSGWRWVVRRPDEKVYAEPVTLWAGTPTLDRWRSSRLLWQRACTITIDVTIADGDRGVLVAHGDQGGGYVVYIDGGSLTFLYNDGHGSTTTIDGGRVAAGAHQIDVSLGAPGGRRWIVTLSVDGSPVGETIDVPMLFPMAPFQGIDVGIDRRSPVSWELYEREGPFPFTGALRSVRYAPGEPAPDSGDRFVDFLKELGSKYE